MKLLACRLLLSLLLPWLLGSCAVYDRFFHPHRLGTPPITASAKAKHKAAEKARHKGLTLGAPTDGAKAANAGDPKPVAADASNDATSPEPAAAAPAADAKTASKGLPDNVRNTYDKNGHLKRSLLQRMEANRHKLHHYDLSAPPHTDATADARSMRKHPKGKGRSKAAPAKDAADETAAAPEPEPDPTQPATKPARKAPAARPAASPRPTSAKARPAPRPAPKPHAAAKPKPRPAPTPPTNRPADTPAADEPRPESRPTKKEKPAKVKKPKRDKNGNKLPKADPTQPAPED